MGAAIALYSTTCYALGRYGTGHAYTINLRATVGLSGWLPGWRYKYMSSTLSCHLLTQRLNIESLNITMQELKEQNRKFE